MSSRSVRVTPKPPSPKSCSQFMAMWEWHAGRRMNGAHSLVTQSNEGQHLFSGSSRSFSAALKAKKILNLLILPPKEGHKYMHSCSCMHNFVHPRCKKKFNVLGMITHYVFVLKLMVVHFSTIYACCSINQRGLDELRTNQSQN